MIHLMLKSKNHLVEAFVSFLMVPPVLIALQIVPLDQFQLVAKSGLTCPNSRTVLVAMNFQDVSGAADKN